MDLARFGLSRRPFRPGPDTAGYVATPSAEAALTGLHQAFAGREGMALVDGAPGLGKTLIALKFLEELDADVPRLFLPAARFGCVADFFQTVLFDQDVSYQGLTEHELRLAVTDRLLVRMTAGPTVLVLDEAQHLSADLLEELRLLGNLESRTAKALFVVLVAQPGFRDRLAHPDAAGFAQRLSARLKLDPLSAEESEAYLVGQLRWAGARSADVLTPDARQVLAASCGGVPRVLNQAAAAAFALAGAAGEKSVDAEAAADALGQLGVAVQDPAGGGPMQDVPSDPDADDADAVLAPDPPKPGRAKPGRRRSA